MPFAFTTGQHINTTPAQIVANKGCRQVLGTIQARVYLHQARQWALRSPTAQRILRTIDQFPHPVYLVAMDGGFTCFDPNPGPGGTVYMDVNINAQINVGGYARAMAGAGGHNWQGLSSYVVLLHECGHAIQHIENPLLFANNRAGPRSALSTDIANAARAVGQRKHPNAPYRQIRQWYARNGPAPGRPWSVRLEYDNVFRHERPICMEAGEPVRDFYGDIR